MNAGAVLVVPACEPGHGGGHLIRCMALVNGLRTLGRDSWLFLPALTDVNNFFNVMRFDRNRLMGESGLSNIHWECIILDRFQTPPEELARWTLLAPVIGIDEGGPSRDSFDFLIDILPGCHRISPNIADPSLLPLPDKPRAKDNAPAAPFKVLISFGQEDAAGLGPAAAESLAAHNSDAEITLLRGGINSPLPTPHSPKTITTIPDLNKHLHEYNLLITHYGITAFEALYAGVPVLLVSPGAYHEKLAQKAGFYSLGVGKTTVKKLKCLLFNKDKINHTFLHKLKNRCAALAVQYNLDHAPRRSLAELINGVIPNVNRNCPVCGTELHGPALARFSERAYRRCTCCGIISMSRINPPPIEYAKEYFFEQYQQQYGKTYIEDFPHLKTMGKRRLAVIKKIGSRGTGTGASGFDNTANGNTPLLLDIGCAYGPFLAAAREEGFSPCGIDPAEDAVRYVTQNLNIPAIQGFFPIIHSPPKNARETLSVSPEQKQNGVGPVKVIVTSKSEGPLLPTPHSPYSVITLWYVIEHFRDCVPVLAEIRKLLKPGGVLAFATPSFSGISGRASLKRFLENSPADHWTIWSPAVCVQALKTAGFTVEKTVNSGHHPERFPLLGIFARSRKSPLYGLLLAISKIFSLGDTFEVYAVRD
ncbi:MAG: class I SAM-dependent methyltransferase [Treponema sp.]|jgi:2-polyprenyl-3-methyl-5-hydroxy-6-metoxy-1,4-benzoquinol methylase/spore coat polysaccharide biosynthesis predicted glycosyltransferase SpsG|nr:class I SAM-dependent methyltransferase [Treponema sp.]